MPLTKQDELSKNKGVTPGVTPARPKIGGTIDDPKAPSVPASKGSADYVVTDKTVGPSKVSTKDKAIADGPTTPPAKPKDEAIDMPVENPVPFTFNDPSREDFRGERGPDGELINRGPNYPPGRPPTYPPIPPTDGGTGASNGTVNDTASDTQTTQTTTGIKGQMRQNADNPIKALEDRQLLHSYQTDNAYLKDANGNLILDANGNPQEDPSFFMDPLEYQMGVNQAGLTVAEVAPDVAVQDFETSLIKPEELQKNLDEIKKIEPMKAASMSEKLNGLLEGMEQGNIPTWARPAVTKVEQALAGRGVSASSIGRDSLFNAIIQAAMPIAQQDATYEQEANKTNYNAKVQALFEDTKIDFAAKQFNASSENDKNKFVSQLKAQVDGQNAARKDAMSQFNAGESNRLEQFNANLAQQREQFNVQMAAQIDAATVQWRRQMNTANTAGINAVNQANVSNAFNMSNKAQSALWQELRDEAQWNMTATENEKDRKHEMEVRLLEASMAQGVQEGSMVENLVNDLARGINRSITDKAVDAIGGFISSLGD